MHSYTWHYTDKNGGIRTKKHGSEPKNIGQLHKNNNCTELRAPYSQTKTLEII